MSKPAPNEASLLAESQSEERLQQGNAEVEAGVVATVVVAGETQTADGHQISAGDMSGVEASNQTNVTQYEEGVIIDAGVVTTNVTATVVASSGETPNLNDRQMPTEAAMNQNQRVPDELDMMETDVVAATVVASEDPPRLDAVPTSTTSTTITPSTEVMMEVDSKKPAPDASDMMDEDVVASGVAATVIATPVPPSTNTTEVMMEVDSMDKKMPAQDGGDISDTSVIATGVAATVVASPVPPTTTNTVAMMEIDSMDETKLAPGGDGISETDVVAAGVSAGIVSTVVASPEPPTTSDQFVKTEAMIDSDSMEQKKPAKDTNCNSNTGSVAVAAAGVTAGLAAGVAATPETPSANIQQTKTAPKMENDSLNRKQPAQDEVDSDDDEILVTVVASPEPEDWCDNEIIGTGAAAASIATGEPEDWQDHQIHTSYVERDATTNSNSHFIDVSEEDVGEDVPLLGSESSGSICEVEPLLSDTPERAPDGKDVIPEGEEKFDMLVKKVSDLEKENTRLNKYGAEMEAFRLRLNEIDSLQKIDALGGVKGKRPEDDPENHGAVFVKNASDTFAFIMMDPISLPAFVSWFIFLVQFVSLILLVVSDLYLDRHEASNEYKNKPLFNIPKGVDPTVHAGQGLAIFLVILVQGSLWESTANISLGYNSHLARQGVFFKWWVISNCLRLIEGLFATFVTYTLVIKSENVVDLFKDFTAISFVSSFDNIVYNLASMRMLGRRMKKATMKSDDITFRIEAHRSGRVNKSFWQYWCDLNSIRKAVFHPSVFVSATMVSMYAFWAINVLKPHNDGKYLCQQIYVQLDGDVNHELPFFSGSYTLLSGKESVDLYPRYREKKQYYEKHSRENTPMIFRFCGNMGRWGFAYENKENPSAECVRDNMFVMSEVVLNQQKYDILDVLQEEWNVFHSASGNWMPLHDYVCECEDRELMHDVNSFDICDAIETDERESPFATSRSFQTQFNTLKDTDTDEWVTVNDHQIYASNEVDGSKDLVLHLGKRWAITSSRDLKDFDKTKTTLESYLSEDFHGKWSNYEVAFYSEKVLADSPKSVMTTVGLSWVEAVPQVDNESQKANHNIKTKSSFICQLCSESNPCFYNGVCLEDQKCYCTTGSSGTLCQVLPTNNGHCDPYFNKREFSYDGGDCCSNTCMSSNDYKCGKDESAFFYIGYDTCETESCTDCFRKNKSTSSINSLVVTYVTLSASGRNLALIESVTSSVRVYDIDGSSWVMRGSAVTSVINPTSDSVHLSGSDYAITNRDVFGPLSVAVKSGSSVHIYDWKGTTWKESLIGDSSVSTNVEKIDFQNNAESLGILYHDQTFKVFYRSNINTSWKLRSSIVSDLANRKFLSLSNDGDKLAMANETCIEIHDLDQDKKSATCDNFDGREVMGVQLSPKGYVLAVLVYYEGTKGDLYEYDVRGLMFKKLYTTLRGVTSVNATVSVSDSGATIGTHSVADNLLRFYEWKNQLWSSDDETRSYTSATTSSDQNIFAAVTLPEDTASDPVVVYRRNVGCGNGMSRLRSTFIPDEAPFELKLEILHINMTGDVNVLDTMGPSEIPLEMLVQELCVSDDIIVGSQSGADYCLAIRITDTGMDGFKTPGHFGVTVNGTKHVSISSTNGYSNVIHVLGNPSCMSFVSDNYTPWPQKYALSQHVKCNTMECNWNKIGSIRNDHAKETDLLLKFSSISADGSIVAVSNPELDNGIVRLFKYKMNVGWIQMGQNLTTSLSDTKFGYSTDLSADGMTLVTSAINYNANGVNAVGFVRTYVYNTKSEMWEKLGDDILGTELDQKLGFTVSLSADGLVMAASASGGTPCHAFVYKYDKERNKWSQWGSCFKAAMTKQFTRVKLASAGSSVAISYYKATRFTGEVEVYTYEYETEDWQRLGNAITGDADAHFLGYSFSISSDGLVVAASGIFRYPAKVYEYNSKSNKWEQRGQGIPSKGGTYFDLHLAPQGSVLVVTSGEHVSVFTYDSVSDLWVESLTEFPTVDLSNPVRGLIVASADALTIAAKADNSIDLYRLKTSVEGSSHCGDNYLFKFTIQPDKFPQDIDWQVKNRNGIDVLGERLSDAPGVRTFQQCLPKNNTYLFDINDMYGDGICCNWGQGSFNVEWDSELAVDSVGFSSRKTVCFPLRSNLTVLTLESENFKQGSSWSLTDIDNNILLEKDGTRLSGEKTFSQQCVRDDECLRFGMFNIRGNGFPYSISLLNETVSSCADSSNCAGQNPVESFRFKTIQMGKCDSKPSACPSNHTLLELELGLTAFPEDTSWSLLKRKGDTAEVLFSGGEYTQVYKYHYHPLCVPTSPGDCFRLILKSATFAGENVKVSWNESSVIEGVIRRAGSSIIWSYCEN